MTRPAPKPAPTVHALREAPRMGLLRTVCGFYLRDLDNTAHELTLTPTRVTCERCRKAMGVA